MMKAYGVTPEKQEEARRIIATAPPSPDSGLPGAMSRRGRITVIETVYFQGPDAEPTSRECNFSNWVGTDEQPYLRRCRIGEAFKPLDLGWLSNIPIGLVCIDNHEGSFPEKLPTPQEKANAAAKVLEVSFGLSTAPQSLTMHDPPSPPPTATVPAILVKPGEGVRFQPAAAKNVLIRCRSGEARVTITVFPA